MISEILTLGVVISIIFYEITDISPGGLIVPAYCALYMDHPRKLLATLLIAVLSALLVKLLSQYSILYGRRRFAVCIMLSFLLKTVFRFFNIRIFAGVEPFMFTMEGIGTIIPGILAHEIDRNGWVRTISALIMLSVFIKAVIEILYGIGL